MSPDWLGSGRSVGDWYAKTYQITLPDSGAFRMPPLRPGTIVQPRALWGTNRSGGTSDLHALAGAQVRVVKAFYDDETGWRYWGDLVEESDIARARDLNATAYPLSEEQWAAKEREMREQIGDARFTMADHRVYFSEWDLAG